MNITLEATLQNGAPYFIELHLVNSITEDGNIMAIEHEVCGEYRITYAEKIIFHGLRP